MNELIKELLLKAGFTNAYTDPKEGFELVFVDEDHTLESVTKFAELIVKECIWAVWTEECRTSDLASEEYTRGSNKIKEHFGIEE